MSFVRPEATAALMRWREIYVGGFVLLVGVWWVFGLSGLMPYLGSAMMIIGGILIVIGFQRGRFRVPGDGPGLVRVTEDQIAYFGPLTGGVVALSDLTRLQIQADGKPAHWVLSQPGQPDLFIPTTADGAEALFDAFARLPGLRTEQMLTRMKTPSPGSATIWERSVPVRKRLH
ncbi:hypothetical protein [Roseovarius sp. 2305UL8-3]|uniref:hypothetical protein n=1 Tax=Roseovarius conchicola TaxID=3121636 RepID=UPI0035297935